MNFIGDYYQEFEYHKVWCRENEGNTYKCQCGVICLTLTEWEKHVEEEHETKN